MNEGSSFRVPQPLSLNKCAKLLTLTLNACNRVSDISSLQHCALVTLELNGGAHIYTMLAWGDYGVIALRKIILESSSDKVTVMLFNLLNNNNDKKFKKSHHLHDKNNKKKQQQQKPTKAARFQSVCPTTPTSPPPACEDLVDVSALGSCRTLRTLSIRSCSRLTSEALQPLSNCLTLHTLRLHRCYRVTKVDMCLTLRNLELLDLSYCHAVTDISGLRGCRALQTLGLIQCKNLVDVSPLAACAALCTLDMSECSSVSDVRSADSVARRKTDRLGGGWVCGDEPVGWGNG